MVYKVIKSSQGLLFFDKKNMFFNLWASKVKVSEMVFASKLAVCHHFSYTICFQERKLENLTYYARLLGLHLEINFALQNKSLSNQLLNFARNSDGLLSFHIFSGRTNMTNIPHWANVYISLHFDVGPDLTVLLLLLRKKVFISTAHFFISVSHEIFWIVYVSQNRNNLINLFGKV